MIKIFPIIYLLFLPFIVTAQSTVSEEITALEKAEHSALLKGDTAVLKEIWDPAFMVNAPINRVSPNRSVVLGLVKSGFIKYTSFKRNIEQILISGDVAISMGNEEVVPAPGHPHAGETIRRRFTDIWQHKAGRWRLIGRHANVICGQ